MPAPDRAIAVVAERRSASGSIFTVRASATPPARATLAVPYRDHWFHLDDTDRRSRSTLLLVGMLYALQAAPPALAPPAPTLPIGR